MRVAPATIASIAILLAPCIARSQDAAAAPGAEPKVYALVAAMGTEFSRVHQEAGTGSHLPPWRRSPAEVPNDILDRLVLRSLDAEIAAIDAGARRVLMRVAVPRTRALSPAAREEASVQRVIDELRKMAERSQWHRIVVATPAYSALARDGLPARLQGLGLFIQPLCASDVVSCELGFHPPSGPMARAPDGDVRPANYYVAPFSYVKIRVLDPATLTVLDEREVFDHQKLADPAAFAQLDLHDRADRAFVAKNIVGVIERSVHDAVSRSELAGTVEVRDVREVKPGEVRK